MSLWLCFSFVRKRWSYQPFVISFLRIVCPHFLPGPVWVYVCVPAGREFQCPASCQLTCTPEIHPGRLTTSAWLILSEYSVTLFGWNSTAKLYVFEICWLAWLIFRFQFSCQLWIILNSRLKSNCFAWKLALTMKLTIFPFLTCLLEPSDHWGVQASSLQVLT